MGGAAALGVLARPSPLRAGLLAGPGSNDPGLPWSLGHRRACAPRREHTLASDVKAIADGADFIEPDIV